MGMIRGTTGNDLLAGTDEDDTVSGLGGADTLMGTGGADRLDGGNGFDFASYVGSAAAIEADLATGSVTSLDPGEPGDTLRRIEAVLGSRYNDTLLGGEGDNDLRGRRGTDLLFGGEGDDSLDGGSGQDTLDGGLGSDTARFTSHVTSMTIDLANQSATSVLGGPLTDRLISIENAIGGSGDDHLIGSRIGQSLDGGKGNDTIDGAAGADTLSGDLGADIIRGQGGADTILGARILYPEAHEDDPDGTDWFTAFLVDDGADTLHGGSGSDTVVVPSATYYSTSMAPQGKVHADVNLVAGTLRVDLANATTDRLISIENVTTGTGDDTVHGDAGANRLSVGDGSNIVRAGKGNDTVTGGTLYNADAPQKWQDRLHGDLGDDLLVGNGSMRTSWTEAEAQESGRDYLDGGGGNDTLVGGALRTVMVGGDGADQFQSSNAAHLSDVELDFAWTERPEIRDFDAAEGDQIVISIVENQQRATPTFVGQVADLDGLGEFEFGYAVDGEDVVARFATEHASADVDDDLEIRLIDFNGGLLAEDVLFV